MTTNSGTEVTPHPTRGQFVTTHWSVVMAAGGPDSGFAGEALAKLCETYWFPLYAYLRRRGYSPPDAQDLTQDFFAQLLEHQWIVRADRHKGRFRSFLLMAMNRFLANVRDKANTLKRGKGIRFMALPLDTAETRYTKEPADAITPAAVFERHWALTLLEEVLEKLRLEYAQEGRADWFETLRPCLIGSRESQPYAILASKLGMTEGAIKVAVNRLRERYRARIKAEIAHTVASPADVDSELRHLFQALSMS